MPNSKTFYTGNGTTKNFTVSFPFISRSHVTVKLNGFPALNPMQWTWVNDSTVAFVHAPVVDAAIEITRETPRNVRLVDFQDGAVLTEAELDLAHKQHFFVAQEIIDNYDDLLQAGKVRLATGAGMQITDAQSIIDEMVAEVLDSTLLAELQTRIGDIDTNAQNVIDVDNRMVNLEATVDSLANIDGTGITTFIVAEQDARIAGDTAINESLALMGAKSADSLSWLFDLNTIQVSPGVSLGTRLSGIDSSVGAVSASVTTEQTARVAGDDALAADVVLLQTETGDNAAAILSEASARSSADSAMASDITTLQSSVGSNTTSISSQATTINGIQGKYAVKIDNNGHVSGFGLMSTANNGAVVSEFIVNANKFAVVDPGNGLSMPIVPFAISGGVVSMQNVVIGSALIENLTVGKLTSGTNSANMTQTGNIVLSNTAHIRAGQTSFDTGTGFFLGYNATYGWVMSVGNGSKGFNWDGSTFTIDGALIINSGVNTQTVSANGSGSTSANATINRQGEATKIHVGFSIGGADLGNNGSPFPCSLTLRRGGAGGTIIKTWSNIGGYHEAGGGGDPDFAYVNFSGTFTDTNAGTGSTQYYVSGPATPYSESLDIYVEQTYQS